MKNKVMHLATPDISAHEIRRLKKAAESLAIGAGKILKDGFNRKKRISFKGRIDPVTEYDLKSEKYIVTRIAKEFPDHDILTEEGSDRSSEARFRWVIDPLDGTVNYSHGYPIYSVSIAVQYNNQTVAGAVFDPERNEMFSAGLNSGAFLNNRRINVTAASELHKSMLATGFAYEVATLRKNNIGYFGRVVKKAQAVRRGGSAALDLCYLAAGRFDGFWELDLAPWDMAAAVLIVIEAGGTVTGIRGKKFSIFDNEIMATNGKIHTLLRKTLLGK